MVSVEPTTRAVYRWEYSHLHSKNLHPMTSRNGVLSFAPLPLTSFRVQPRGNPVWKDLITYNDNTAWAFDILLFCNYTNQQGYGDIK